MFISLFRLIRISFLLAFIPFLSATASGPEELLSSDGRIVESIELHRNSYSVSFVVLYYTYDDHNRIIMKEEKAYGYSNYWREHYEYDDDGNLLEYYSDRWETDKWINVEKYAYTYDNNGNRLTWLTQRWRAGKWFNHSKHLYTYDENNILITDLLQYDDNDELVDYKKTTYSYDDRGNVLVELIDYLYGNYITRRNIYEYDEENNVTLEAREIFEDGEWIRKAEFIHTYKYGQRHVYLYRIERNGELADSLRYTSFFNDSGLVIESLHEYWTEGEWIAYRKYTYEHNQNGDKTDVVNFIFENNEWKKYNRYTYQYTDFNAYHKWICYHWDANAEVWREGLSDEQLEGALRVECFLEFEDSYGNEFDIYGYKAVINWSDISSVDKSVDAEQPFQVSPNPFTQSTIINYELPQAGYVSLKVYDLMGNEVSTLVDGFMPAGRHEARFDAAELPEGVYFLKLQAGSDVVTKKVIHIK